ncbi:MAG: FHA domain-containing protein [Deltaproteobacteria bacterium]|nr:FHA domain-containing protein [Deltaproteobacteria bacterium]
MAQLNIYRRNRLEGVFYLPQKPVVIGRAEGVDIQLLDSRVSRRHAVIRESVAGFMIQDMTTKNGTFVNKEAIDKSLLFHGDSVIIGAYTLQFLDEEVEELESQDLELVSIEIDDDHTPALSVPKTLQERKSARPRAVTQNAPYQSPKNRVDRLDRKKPTGKPDLNSIPVIELGGDEDDEMPSFGQLDLSNIDLEIK